MKILEMNEKSWKIKGYTYKITPISVTNCPSVPNLTSDEYNEIGFYSMVAYAYIKIYIIINLRS